MKSDVTWGPCLVSLGKRKQQKPEKLSYLDVSLQGGFFKVIITSSPASPSGNCFTGCLFPYMSFVVVNAQDPILTWHSPGEKDLFRWLPLPQPIQCWDHRCAIRPADLNNFTLFLIIFLFFCLSLLGVFEHKGPLYISLLS